MRPTKDLTGQKFHRLTVLGPTDSPSYWRTLCDCGNEKVVRGSSLVSGNTKSCGCLVRSNPGRPAHPAYRPHIDFDPFLTETLEHFTPIRNVLARYGVIINSKGELRYAGRVEHHADAYAALAHALLKTVKHRKT